MDSKRNSPATPPLARTGLFTRVVVPMVVGVIFLCAGAGVLVYLVERQNHRQMMSGRLSAVAYYTFYSLTQGAPGKDEISGWDIPQRRAFVEETLGREIDLISPGHGSGLMVLDRASGAYLFSYPEGGRNFPDADLLAAAKDPRHSALSTVEGENGQLLAAIYVPSMDAYVVALEKEGGIYQIGERLARAFYIFILPAAVGMAAFLWALLQFQVLRPLTRVRQDMASVLERDDFSGRLPLRNSPEFQQVSHQFNVMLAHVEARDSQLKKHAQKLEEMVRERTKALEETHQKMLRQERLAAIGGFVSSMVHELRNPLSSIKMGVEKLAATEAFPDNDRKRLELVRAQTDRMEAMFSDILGFAAKRPLNLEAVSLADLLAGEEDFMASLTQSLGVSFEFVDIPPVLSVRADPERLTQVLENLLKNAAEASPTRERVIVSARKKGRKAFVEVRNGGEPISPETMERLFEPFFTTKAGGTGLGLPLCRKLVEEMGGTLEVHSGAEGTVVSILLETS